MRAYGNASPLLAAAAFATVGGADVTLTAGTETTIATTGALVAAYPGNYYPLIFCTLAILLGATASTALVIAFKLGSGADVDTYTVPPALLVANATILIGVTLVGVNSAINWIGAGSTINVTGNATTTAATAKNVGSRIVPQLVQGPDI